MASIEDNRDRIIYTELLLNPLENCQGYRVNNIEGQSTCRRLTIIL
jgi:hypothetical protein